VVWVLVPVVLVLVLLLLAVLVQQDRVTMVAQMQPWVLHIMPLVVEAAQVRLAVPLQVQSQA
jgi:hypothetical protein